MTLNPSTISPGKRIKKNTKRVGRGNASGKGTYSARGLKGQKSRSGGKGGLQLKGFKQSLLKVPKLRGFKSHKDRPETVSLSQLEKIADKHDIITPYVLKQEHMILFPRKGAKVLGTGSLTKKVKLEGCLASKAAAEAIEKAGGAIVF